MQKSPCIFCLHLPAFFIQQLLHQRWVLIVTLIIMYVFAEITSINLNYLQNKEKSLLHKLWVPEQNSIVFMQPLHIFNSKLCYLIL